MGCHRDAWQNHCDLGAANDGIGISTGSNPARLPKGMSGCASRLHTHASWTDSERWDDVLRRFGGRGTVMNTAQRWCTIRLLASAPLMALVPRSYGSATSPVNLTSNVACRSFKSIWSTKISRHVEANCLSPRLTTEQNQTQHDHRLLGFRGARCGQNRRHTYELGRECAERRFSRNVFCVFDLWADRSTIAAACSHDGGRWARLCRTDREPTTCRDRGVRS